MRSRSSPPPNKRRAALNEVTSAPATVAGRGSLYCKDVGGRSELFFVDDTGAEIQVTNAGSIQGSTAVGQFDGRIERTSATVLTLARYRGDKVEVNGSSVSLGASGLALATTDNLISSTGADAGAAMGASTLYYVYVSNASASFAPSDLRASTTAPSAVSGIKYLGSSGNALNWRFVGWAYTSGATQFTDDTTDRLVVNFYNRLRKTILLQPGYQDDNALDSFTIADVATWGAANGGTGSTGSYIANGEDAVEFGLGIVTDDPAAGNQTYIGIGHDSVTTAYAMSASQTVATALRSHVSMSVVPAEGRRTVSILVATTDLTSTCYADNARFGGATDPRLTCLQGTVMV